MVVLLSGLFAALVLAVWVGMCILVLVAVPVLVVMLAVGLSILVFVVVACCLMVVGWLLMVGLVISLFSSVVVFVLGSFSWPLFVFKVAAVPGATGTVALSVAVG